MTATRTLAVVLICLGAALSGYYFLFFDPTVQAGEGRVMNLGLMADRQNGIIIGLGICIIGALLGSWKNLGQRSVPTQYMNTPKSIFSLALWLIIILGILSSAVIFFVPWKQLDTSSQHEVKQETAQATTDGNLVNSSDSKSLTGSPAVTASAQQPIVLQGTGHQGTKSFYVNRGLAAISYCVRQNYSQLVPEQPTNFILELKNTDGKSVTIANEVFKDADESQSIMIPAPGNYVFNVDATGDWKIVVSNPNQPALPISVNSSSTETASIVSTQQDNPATTIDKMLQAEQNNDRQSLYESISYLAGLTKPASGDKEEANRLNKIGLGYLKAKQYHGAALAFDSAVKVDLSDAKLLSNLGFAEMLDGDLSSAEKNLYSSLMLAPTRSVTWGDLGELFAKQGDQQKAVACFLIGYQISGGDTLSYLQSLKTDDDPAIREAGDLALIKVSSLATTKSY